MNGWPPPALVTPPAPTLEEQALGLIEEFESILAGLKESKEMISACRYGVWKTISNSIPRRHRNKVKW
jgi:hypothetical protein